MDKEKLFEDCRKKCTCYNNNNSSGGNNGSNKARPSQEGQDAGPRSDAQTFIATITEIVCVIAFILFGTMIFWLSVSGVLFDYLKKLYYSDKNIKIGMACLFSILLLSMTVRVFLNRRACKSEVAKTDADKNTKEGSSSQQPPKEYMEVVFKDKKLRHNYKGGGDDKPQYINKTLTLTIADEKNKPVFKTSKLFFIPEMAMEMKQPPVILVYLKEIALENY